ncbi:MAG: ATP-grasp domain-containing protein [Candidatus Omnitrophica bacterium]|nr:ATP-grasp domain-containing protein [Candidatus Omnitrophota bacterium]
MAKKRTLVVLADMTEEERLRTNEFDTSTEEYSIERLYCAKRDNVSVLRLKIGDFNDREGLKKKILDHEPSCVFNRFEGWSDDSSKEIEFAEILEEVGIPYTGNSPQTLSVCLDKWGAKTLLKKSGVSVAPGIFIRNIEDIKLEGITFPMFLKPCFEDASMGIDDSSLVRDKKSLFKVAEEKLKLFPKGLVAEEFLPGGEYAVGIIGNGPYEVLGLSVLDYTKFKGMSSFLTYDSKWVSNTPEYGLMMPSLDEPISPAFKKKVLGTALKAAEVFGCSGYFRVDMRERDGESYVIDVNPNPDITEGSGFMRMAKKSGIGYIEMLEKIVSLAEERFAKGRA